jgi:hypothetical protein
MMFPMLALVALIAGAQVSFAAPAQQKRAVKGLIPLLAGGAASLLTGDVLNNKRKESGLMVDPKTGVIYMEVPNANEGRSLIGPDGILKLGTTLPVFTPGSVKRSSLQIVDGISDSVLNTHGKELDERALLPILLSGLFNKRGEVLDARSFTALKDLFDDIFDKRSDELDARLLQNYNSYFSDPYGESGEDLDARSITSIKGYLGGLFNKRSEMKDSMVKRTINDLD